MKSRPGAIRRSIQKNFHCAGTDTVWVNIHVKDRGGDMMTLHGATPVTIPGGETETTTAARTVMTTGTATVKGRRVTVHIMPAADIAAGPAATIEIIPAGDTVTAMAAGTVTATEACTATGPGETAVMIHGKDTVMNHAETTAATPGAGTAKTAESTATGPGETAGSMIPGDMAVITGAISAMMHGEVMVKGPVEITVIIRGAVIMKTGGERPEMKPATGPVILSVETGVVMRVEVTVMSRGGTEVVIHGADMAAGLMEAIVTIAPGDAVITGAALPGLTTAAYTATGLAGTAVMTVEVPTTSRGVITGMEPMADRGTETEIRKVPGETGPAGAAEIAYLIQE